MQCHSRGLVNSALHFPTSYEGTHACTHANLGLSSNTWHKRMPHGSPFFICWAFSCAQVPSEMIILTLPRWESLWFSLCQRENLLEAKPVDVHLRRNEGREGKSFSDLVQRKQRIVTAKQFSLPRLRSDSVVRRPWKSAQTSRHQQNTQEAKRKMLPRTWRRLFGLMRDSWPAPQWWRAAPQPASWFEGARAPHVMNIPFERAHQGSDMVTFKRNWPSFAVLV